MTDIKQICAQLIELWDADCDADSDFYFTVKLNELRAALAEPEPEEPTDEELFAVAEAYAEDNGLIGLYNAPDFARAALARWGNYPASPDSSTSPRSEND